MASNEKPVYSWGEIEQLRGELLLLAKSAEDAHILRKAAAVIQQLQDPSGLYPSALWLVRVRAHECTEAIEAVNASTGRLDDLRAEFQQEIRKLDHAVETARAALCVVRPAVRATPTNMQELVEYLTAHPRVRMTSSSPKTPLSAGDTFLRVEGGSMWFRGDDGREHHLPLSCGMVSSETGVKFAPHSFAVEKFGVTITSTYLEDDADGHQAS